jgi:hypothetical protein
MGKIKKAFCYDFKSLRPDVGRQYLPHGEPEEISLEGAAEVPPGLFLGS